MPIPGLDDGKRYPIVVCRNCGAIKNTAWSPQTLGDSPKKDDLSVCIECGCAGIYTGNGIESRKPTDEEMKQIMENPAYLKVVTGLMELHGEDSL